MRVSETEEAKIYYLEDVKICFKHWDAEQVIEINVKKGILLTTATLYNADCDTITETAISNQSIHIDHGIAIILEEGTPYAIVACSLYSEYNYIMRLKKDHLRKFV